jgi:hypothetical protein
MALGLLAVGTFGLFGSERDPLAAVFLLPLGLPWQLWVDHAPEPFWPWLAMLAPLVNLLLLAGCCYFVRLYRRRQQQQQEPASGRHLN